MTAKIDAEDAVLVSRYKWSANETTPSRFYAQAKGEDGRNVYLHRLILDAPAGMLADHRNGDTLDCRRKNLRLATHMQNSGNQKRRANSAGYCGVTMRRGFRYQAKIKHAHTFIHLGYFSTAEEAARAYDAKARELRGEYAVLNFPSPHLSGAKL